MQKRGLIGRLWANLGWGGLVGVTEGRQRNQQRGRILGGDDFEGKAMNRRWFAKG